MHIFLQVILGYISQNFFPYFQLGTSAHTNQSEEKRNDCYRIENLTLKLTEFKKDYSNTSILKILTRQQTHRLPFYYPILFLS